MWPELLGRKSAHLSTCVTSSVTALQAIMGGPPSCTRARGSPSKPVHSPPPPHSDSEGPLRPWPPLHGPHTAETLANVSPACRRPRSATWASGDPAGEPGFGRKVGRWVLLPRPSWLPTVEAGGSGPREGPPGKPPGPHRAHSSPEGRAGVLGPCQEHAGGTAGVGLMEGSLDLLTD